MTLARRSAFSKLAAAALSAALLFPSPLLAAEIASVPELGVGAPIGALDISAVPSPAALAVGSNLFIAPQLPAGVNVDASIEAAAASPAVAQSAAVARHPVIGLLNNLQAQGVSLPSRMATRLDADKLMAAAQAMPTAALREKMTALAHAAAVSHDSTGAGAESFNAAYDSSQAAAAEPVGFWGKIKQIASGKKAAPKAIDPTTRELSPSQVRWTAPIDLLPASTKDHPEETQQIVGQDDARRNIKFGLELQEDPAHKGSKFNLYISGPAGSGRETALRSIVTPLAASMATPTDLVAVTNFKDPEEPTMLELATGNAPKFKEAVDGFIENYGMAVMQAMSSPEIVKQKRSVETARDKAVEKRKADLEAAVADIRLEVPSQNNEWGIKAGVVEGKLFAVPTYRAKGSRGAFTAFTSQEEIDAAVASGKMTREEFAAAIKAASAEGKNLKEDFQKMEGQNAVDKTRAQMSVEMLNRQAAAMAAEELAPEILSTVAEDRHSTPEHDAWQKTAEARIKAFNAEVAKQLVNGKYGFIVTQQTLAEGMIGITKLQNGKMTPVKDVESEGLSEADLKAIVDAATPFVEKLQKIVEEINVEHQELHKNDPPYEGKAVEYVQNMLGFAATNYQIFMPHEHEKGKPHFDADELIRVNVLQANVAGSGAPVVWESNPTYARLFGMAEGAKKRMMIDGMAQVANLPGGPVIEPGSYLKARGGFLVLDVMQVLREPGAWPALMQAVRNGEAEVAEEGLMGLYSNGDKYHVPGKTKIVFVGSPYIRMMLEHYDEDFAAGFQAPVAEFGRKLDINEASINGYLDFMKNVIRKAKGLIMDFEQDGIAALLESSARDIDSNKKLSAQFGVSDVRMRKASQVAADRLKADPSGPKGVTRADLEKAQELDLQSEKVHEKGYQELLRDNIFILDNSGAPIVGQINGLAVMGSFGVPMRKTFVAGPANGKRGISIVSDDRNAGTTGSSYNKAIEVLSGLLNLVFPQKRKPSAEIRISAEQNYGGIDGDSATSTQFYGILSALSGIGIKPNLAVTGSADQFGHVQAIGGVNEKIEGFYDLCKMRGLTGDQGVMIPKSNVGDLMLKPEIVAAIKAGKFHIYAVDNIRDGWEIMTGTSYDVAVAKAYKNYR